MLNIANFRAMESLLGFQNAGLTPYGNHLDNNDSNGLFFNILPYLIDVKILPQNSREFGFTINFCKRHHIHLPLKTKKEIIRRDKEIIKRSNTDSLLNKNIVSNISYNHCIYFFQNLFFENSAMQSTSADLCYFAAIALTTNIRENEIVLI